MHWEKATIRDVADPPVFAEPLEGVADGLPPHAATSKARTAIAMIAATVRAVGSAGMGFMGAVLRPGG
jgi:hypothetical protein